MLWLVIVFNFVLYVFCVILQPLFILYQWQTFTNCCSRELTKMWPIKEDVQNLSLN